MTSGDRDVGHGELLATAILSLASVVTAWCAFQGTKWSSQQADDYNSAATARVEGTRISNIAAQKTAVDVSLFVNWLNAYARDHDVSGAVAPGYQPNPRTLDGFLFERFGPPLKRATLDWLQLEPLQNPTAAQTPFAMPSYVMVEQSQAEALSAKADTKVASARRANGLVDNYAANGAVLAMALFFAGMATKMRRRTAVGVMLAIATLALLAGAVLTARLPIKL